MKNPNSIFSRFLSELGTPHTKKYTDKVYREHPYKNSLYGLSSLLTRYHIASSAVRYDNKDALPYIQTPFIAEVSSDLAIVKSVTTDKVCFDWYGNDVILPISEFLKFWSGVALMVLPDSHSQEPDYHAHKQSLLKVQIKYSSMFFCMLLIAISLGIYNHVFDSWLSLLVLLINMVGLFLSIQLLFKQLDIHTATAEKICTLWHSNSCHKVLDMPASKLLGLFSLSEIGVAYFTSNLLFCLLGTNWLPYMGIVSSLSLLFSIWSIWYQKYRAKSWCTLCLLVQVIFLIQAVIYLFCLFGGHFNIPFAFETWVLMLCCYAVAVIVVNLLAKMVADIQSNTDWEYKYKHIIAQESVLQALVSKQPDYDTGTVSSLVFGATNTGHELTIISNPYCSACRIMHKHLAVLLQRNCRIRYVFAFYNPKQRMAAKFLIASYMKHGDVRAWDILSEWYENPKRNMIDLNDADELKNNREAEQELLKHEKWLAQMGFNSTPTVLIDGKVLPSPYEIEDILRMTEP